jgi:hypothetical protein
MIVGSDGYNRQSCEYSLPVREAPDEMDTAWAHWMKDYVDRDVCECHALLERRFQSCGSELCDLAKRVLEYVPRSLIVYKGTPYLRLDNRQVPKRFISVPPELDVSIVQRSLEAYKLDEHQGLVELFALFGGTYDQSPGGAVSFGGRRRAGVPVIEPSATDFEAGQEYLAGPEVAELGKRFERWMGGVQVLKGDDGLYWHLGGDGTVCEHECGSLEYGVFDSLSAMIDAVLKASTAECLFEGAYFGLPGAVDP